MVLLVHRVPQLLQSARPALRAAPARCLAMEPAPGALRAATLIADGEISIVDTVLDIAVYTLLAGVLALTLYSLYATLGQANKDYGGWTKKDGQPDAIKPPSSDAGGYRKGARYDPVTDQWTYPTKEAPVASASAASTDPDNNRYGRRLQKKQKRMDKRRKMK